MTSTSEDDYRSNGGFFHRSLSPCSFERLRQENSDYFYKPKRGPSTSKSNKIITRPIKTFETVTKLVELLSKGNTHTKTEHVEDIESGSLIKKLDEQKSSSYYSSLVSIDDDDRDLSLSFSSTSTVPEQESQIIVLEESIIKPKYLLSSYNIPAIGINLTMTNLHLVLLELYPQNVDYSIIIFQRYLLSLILHNEHKDWSILNVNLQTKIEQEGNFRLFTLTYEEFDHILKDLQLFINTNSSLALSFVLNIALTGEQTTEYEKKISSRLNKINLNFDIISSRAETYMIGIDFFIKNHQDEFIDIYQNKIIENKKQFYPYLLIHAESTTTFFYIIHSSNKYSILTSNNLCYKTYSNLLKLLQPGYDEQISSSSFPIRRPPPISFDLSSSSFTNIPQRYFPCDYSQSKTTHYIYRGWSNQKISPYNKNLITYDVHTQTDDSFLDLSSSQIRLAMHRSLLSMFIINIGLIIKLLLRIYPSIENCLLIGEFFQLEKQITYDLTLFLRDVLGDKIPQICQLKRESLISAIGCALPRVYFDIIDEEEILETISQI